MNKSNSVIYVGVTNNLHKRILAHKEGSGSLFTKKYNVNKLVYFEEYYHPQDAIAREKQIKNYSRKRKDELVVSTNPEFKDLFDKINPW